MKRISVATVLLALAVTQDTTPSARSSERGVDNNPGFLVDGSLWTSAAAYRATRDAERYHAAYRDQILAAHPNQYVFIHRDTVHAFPGADWVEACRAADGISPSGGGFWVGTWPIPKQ